MANKRVKTAARTKEHWFLMGGGEMGALMRSYDWSTNPAGDIAGWPDSLRTTIGILLNSSFPMCIWWGKQELTNFYNDAYKEILGNKHPGALGKPAQQAWPETWDSIGPLVAKVYRTGKPVYEKNLRLTINRHGYDEETYFTFSYSPVRDAAATIVGIFCTVTETTEEVSARLRLQESEERFRTLIEKSADAVQLVTAQGEIIYSSDSIKNVLGYTPEELARSGVLPYLHPDDKEYFFKNFQDLLDHPEKQITMQYRVKHKDGSWAWLETVGANHLETTNIHALVGNFRNITRQKEAEDKLRSSEGRFRALAENIPNLAWMADATGYIYWYNTRWYEYTGTKPKDMEGWGWHSVHDPAVLPEVIKKWSHSIKSGQPFDMVFPIKGADGVFRPFLTRVAPIISEDGTPIQWVGTNTDISEQLKVKQAEARNEELQTIAQQLAVQRKGLISLNRTKDEFIGMASHQLRTPATAVKQYISLLIDEVFGPLNAQQLHYLQVAYDSNERELHIINDLLKTAQMDSTEYKLNQKRQDIVQLMQEAIDEMTPVFTMRDQRVVFDVPPAPLVLLVDAIEMKLVFVNLLENASKYSHSGKDVRVIIKKTVRHVSITVSDKGVGIAKDDHERVFEKFTRIDNELSDTVSGTGLGLYWVKQLVELHGGTVGLSSETKKGSRFTVKLPL